MQISEAFLHYLWKYKLYDTKKLTTTNGLHIEVLHTGLHNRDAGPDFTNARIKINDQIWAGTIEIHQRASDWIRHEHHKDPAYNNVILHIVAQVDTETFLENGRLVPTACISFPAHLLENYKRYIKSYKQPLCADDLYLIDNFNLANWFDVLIAERFEEKTNNLKQLLEYTAGNKEEAFYIFLAAAFGGKVNSTAFELTAKSLPLTILIKHKNNAFQIEALLLGQAGLLNSKDIQDEYILNLQKEYLFLKQKYKLKNIEPHLWKYLRIRPANFPEIRLAQFALLIHKSVHLFSKILEAENIETLTRMFNLSLSGYWDTHYRIGKKSSTRTKKFGKTASRSVIINTVIPTLFLYGKEKNEPQYQEKAIQLLEQIAPENNNIIRKWQVAGISPKNAAQTQAILQLDKKYCKPKLCLDCRIGNQLITNK